MTRGVGLDRREWMLGTLALALGSGGMPAQRGSANAAPAALGPADGDLVYVGRDPVRIKVSPEKRGRFAMITQDVSAGTSIPVHLHENEDEIIFIQRGEGRATLGETSVTLQAGSTLYVPQGTWHGGENTGAGTMSWIAIYSPSGFEGYFREIGVRPDGTRPAPL